jgi:hypothetical protein
MKMRFSKNWQVANKDMIHLIEQVKFKPMVNVINCKTYSKQLWYIFVNFIMFIIWKMFRYTLLKSISCHCFCWTHSSFAWKLKIALDTLCCYCHTLSILWFLLLCIVFYLHTTHLQSTQHMHFIWFGVL